MMNNTIQNYIDAHGICSEYLFKDWESFLDSILIELEGFDVDEKTIDYYSLYHKLASCRRLNYKYFRKTILRMELVELM